MLLPLVSDVDVRTVQGVYPDGQATPVFSSTALHLACQNGQHQMAKALLKRGADRMARDSLQMTPLSWAAEEGHLACAVLLIGQKGRYKLTPAEVNAVDSKGCSALHLASFQAHLKIACSWRLARGWMQCQHLVTLH